MRYENLFGMELEPEFHSNIPKYETQNKGGKVENDCRDSPSKIMTVYSGIMCVCGRALVCVNVCVCVCDMPFRKKKENKNAPGS